MAALRKQLKRLQVKAGNKMSESDPEVAVSAMKAKSVSKHHAARGPQKRSEEVAVSGVVKTDTLPQSVGMQKIKPMLSGS